MSTQRAYIVTGASRGVGLAVVTALAALPDILVFLGARDIKHAESLVSSIETGKNSEVVALHNDVADDASIQKSIREVEKELKKRDLPAAIAGLVNNAGVNLEYAHYTKTGQFRLPSTPEEVRTLLNDTYQVFGAAAMLVACLPLLKAYTQSKAVILNVTSAMGSITYHTDPDNVCYHLATPGYSTSKSALNALVVSYAAMHPDIRIVPVHPGFLATEGNGYPESAIDVAYGGKYLVGQLLDTQSNGAFVGPEGGIGGPDAASAQIPW